MAAKMRKNSLLLSYIHVPSAGDVVLCKGRVCARKKRVHYGSLLEKQLKQMENFLIIF